MRKSKLEINICEIGVEENPDLREAYLFARKHNATIATELYPLLQIQIRSLPWLSEGRRSDLRSDAAEIYGIDRHLPILSELLTPVGDTLWTGFLNSDIVLTPYFFGDFEAYAPNHDMLLVRVSDIPGRRNSHVYNAKRWSPRRNAESVDGVLIRNDARIEIPDLVIGEPFWDNYLVELSKRLGGRSSELPARCALHPKHTIVQPWRKSVVYKDDYADWEGLSDAAAHNRRLFLDLRDAKVEVETA